MAVVFPEGSCPRGVEAAHPAIRHKDVVHCGAEWCRVLYIMVRPEKSIRQSVSLPARIAKHVRLLARTQNTSANRVLVDLIEAGLDSKEREKQRFFELANRLVESADSAERQRIKEELA